ncbi:MAG: VWA domain-containing protein [Pedosphaera sp.]|nr:VWA domain-containing protein [Pedosphaera sp.]
MIFLNLILLGGAAAISIPILVHLFNRSRFRQVRWGAMHLLDTTMQVQKRRLKIENLLLMLLRCLIPLCLAFSMARPVWTGTSALMGDSKTSLVVLIDNSYSLDYRGVGGSNMEKARDMAANIVKSLQRGSDVSVVFMSGTNATMNDTPVFNLAQMVKDLSLIEASYGKADVPRAIDVGAALSQKMAHAQREMILISDFQRVSWDDADAPARAHAVALMRKSPLPTTLALIHVGEEASDNLCVESLEFSRLVLGVKQPLQVRASLRAFGKRDYRDVRVVFEVDGKEIATAAMTIAAGEQRQVLFTHTFADAGSHRIKVTADADSLKADNSYEASIPVLDRVPALVIDGKPSNVPLEGETDFLRLALQPFEAVGQPQLTDLIRVNPVTSTAFAEKDIGDARIVVAANVAQFNPDQLRLLRDFVKSGGGLLIFAGDQVQIPWYNQQLASHGLLPMSLAGIQDRSKETVPYAKVQAQKFLHPALEFFNDPRNGNLAESEIQKWIRLREEPDNPLLTVLARLENGDPFMVEKKFGDGRVIFCASACDLDWGNLPLKSSYLPLMQRLVVYLATTVLPPRNLSVGQPLVAFYSAQDKGLPVKVTDPAGVVHPLEVAVRGGKGVVEFLGTQRPGMYLLEGPDSKPVHYVVNIPREESNLEPLQKDQRQAAAAAMRVPLVATIEEYLALDRKRRFGVELWKPLFWAVLAFLISEMLLVQWMVRRRK